MISHHGGMKVDTPMLEMMQQITQWLSIPQNNDELVVLYVSHFEGEGDEAAKGCSTASESVLLEVGMTNIVHAGTSVYLSYIAWICVCVCGRITNVVHAGMSVYLSYVGMSVCWTALL